MILAAAWKFMGKVYVGETHEEALQPLLGIKKTAAKGPLVKGYVSDRSDGIFLDIQQSYAEAKTCGQVTRDGSCGAFLDYSVTCTKAQIEKGRQIADGLNKGGR